MDNTPINASNVLRYLKSRYPFHMIDNVDELVVGEYAKGNKLLSSNDWFFGNVSKTNQTVMPSSIQVESLEEILILTVLTMPENKNCSTRFISASIDFHHPVYLGDNFIMEAKVLSWKRGVLKGSVKGYVNKKKTSEGNITIIVPEIFEKYAPQNSTKLTGEHSNLHNYNNFNFLI